MQSKICQQVQNFDKNTDIKYPNGSRLFFGCGDGSVQEFSMISETTVHDHGKILSRIVSMAKTSDNKS